MDEYETQIQEGKHIVTDYIKKERQDYSQRIDAMEWGRSPEDKGAGLHALVLLVGDKRHLLKFSEKELADSPKTPEIRLQLRLKVDEFFQTLNS